MEKSLTSVLYHSRRMRKSAPAGVFDDGRHYGATYQMYVSDTPIVLLVRLLESECALHGLTLCRWQTGSRHSGRIRITSWGVVQGDRPATSYDDGVIHVVRFSGNEGQTERCIAYRSLLNLLDAVMQSPIRGDEE